MDNIAEVLKEKKDILENNVKRYINNNVNNVNKDISNNVNADKDILLEELLRLYNDKPNAIALTIAEKLGDKKNLNFYIKLVKANNPHKLFEILSITLEAYSLGQINSTRAKYFVGVLKRKGVRW